MLKEANVFQCHTQQIGHIHEIGEFAGRKPLALCCTYADDAQSAIFPWQRQGDQELYARFEQSLLRAGIPFILRFQELAFLFQDTLRPGLQRRNFAILRKILRFVTHRGASHQLCIFAFAFHQPDDSMRGIQTIHELRKHLVDYILHGKSLGAGRGQQRQPAHLVV